MIIHRHSTHLELRSFGAVVDNARHHDARVRIVVVVLSHAILLLPVSHRRAHISYDSLNAGHSEARDGELGCSGCIKLFWRCRGATEAEQEPRDDD